MRDEDLKVLAELRQKTVTVLREEIGDGSSVALLDAPNQRNVGDSLIWAGEIEYFKALGLKVEYVADRRSYEAGQLRRALPPGGVILIHGGGNFGDLWLSHQEHREQIARDFPDHKIVQLPQSVWFESTENAARANEVLGRHKDFTLLVRDRESAARASASLPDVKQQYCWDMALGWNGRETSKTAADSAPVLVIARTDHESSSGLTTSRIQDELGVPVTVADWTSPGLDTLAWRASRLIPRVAHKYGIARGPIFRPVLNASFSWINRANIRGGVRLYRGRRYVIADRLHAHILASLLGIDHVLLDNNYGKLGAVYRDYSGRFSTSSYASSVSEAAAIATQAIGAERLVA